MNSSIHGHVQSIPLSQLTHQVLNTEFCRGFAEGKYEFHVTVYHSSTIKEASACFDEYISMSSESQRWGLIQNTQRLQE